MTQVSREPDLITLLRGLDKRLTGVERTSKYDDESVSDLPPLPPNLYLIFDIRETKTDPEYRAIVKWGTVSPNTCQADVDHWVVDIQATNSSGTPIDQTPNFPDSSTISVLQQKRIENKGQTDPHWSFQHIPRPTIWYWRARIRIKDKAHRLGPWSAWTTPQLPFATARPKPPTPTGIVLSFDTIEKTRWDRVRAIVTWNELTTWDLPGGDHNADVDRYVVQLRPTNSSGTPLTTTYRTRYVSSRVSDPDEAATLSIAFEKHIKKSGYYQCRVKSIDRYNRRGDWSDWLPSTPIISTDNTAPPVPTNVVLYGEHNDVAIEWSDPLDTDTDLVNSDVAYYQVQVATDKNFTNKVLFDKMVAGNRRQLFTTRYKQRYFLRVRSVDASDNKSAWKPSTSLYVYPQKVGGVRQVVSGSPKASNIDFSNENGLDLIDAQTNRAYLVSNTTNAVLLADTEIAIADASYKAVIQLSNGAGGHYEVGVVLKADDVNNLLLVRIIATSETAGTLTIGKRSAGTFTLALASVATTTGMGDEITLEARYISSTGQVQAWLDGVNVLNYTLTSGEKTAYQDNQFAGLWEDYNASAGSGDNKASRFDSFTVTDTASGQPTLSDEFDRTPDATIVGTSDSGHVWGASAGVWGIAPDSTPGAVIGYSTILPMFYAQYTTEVIKLLTSSSYTNIGEGGFDTVAMTLYIDRPTRFLCWAVANCMLNETTGVDNNVKLYIRINPNDGSGFSRGQPGYQLSPLSDYTNSKRRFIGVMRDYYYDPGASIAQIDFYWAWSIVAGTNRSVALNDQKMSVLASYAPDFAPSGVTNPGASWTRKGANLVRYRKAETGG